MKFRQQTMIYLLLLTALVHCKEDDNSGSNRPPAGSLLLQATQATGYRWEMTADVDDPDLDALTYRWDFGDGTRKLGAARETHIYADNAQYEVRVTVSDGKDSIQLNGFASYLPEALQARTDITWQTIEGFGGFGARDVYWSEGPFHDAAFINTLINDLGVTMLRDEIPTSFEHTNDNNDPLNLNLAGYNLNTQPPGHHKPLGARIPYFKAMKDAGLDKMIASVWSPPVWMKHNGILGNGTTNQNSAPPYTQTPTSASNQLRTNLYEEFAEMCVAYVRILKQEAGIDLYALSIQNEPRFSQFYQSCVYDGQALRELLRAVGRRFKQENINTRLFLPEDIGWLQGIEGMIKPSLDDPETRDYVDVIAVHGYDFNGVTVNSPNAQTWNTMQSWGAPYGIPLWMTETSGFENTYQGALDLATAMYTALRHGKVSAWCFWTLSTNTLDEYSLMSSSGTKSKRYYASKQFYKFIRPGAVQFQLSPQTETGNLLTLGFHHPATGKYTLVLINRDVQRAYSINWDQLPHTGNWRAYMTSESLNCEDQGLTEKSKPFVVPSRSIVTLVSE